MKGLRMRSGQSAMDYFSSGGVRIAYFDQKPENGEGMPVVLVHGFASTHRVNWIDTSWVSTLNRAGYRVIALDNRGHGQSDKLYDPEAYDPEIMARDVIALLDHLHIPRADLIGYSMGARISAMAALRFPERVRAVILGGLGIHLVEGNGLPPGIAEALIATAMGLFAAIPAVVAYNRFAGDVNRLATRFDSFMEEFSNILQRQS